MTEADIWATAIGGAGLVVAIVTLVIAGVAQSKAGKATEVASKAAERAAGALKQANELTLKLNAPPPAPWTLDPGAGSGGTSGGWRTGPGTS